ncbi:hypothetical protein TIFTF001_007637 [Ficus carica]|uniref:Uncharacterized protein n=1 Tax=Ficus carica TaxID=3494 RepID=A0AA88D126_FICCA|nr:hypothetical protein TIFTF001_007637 [Ficus carica]
MNKNSGLLSTVAGSYTRNIESGLAFVIGQCTASEVPEGLGVGRRRTFLASNNSDDWLMTPASDA